jgi:hypothetical protein
VVYGRKGQCGDCECVHLNSLAGDPPQSRIAGEMSKKRAPDGGGSAGPMKIGRLECRLRMGFELGKPPTEPAVGVYFPF